MFENVFLVGFYYEGIIVCCDDWGVIVQMLYGLEVFVFIKYICKEDGQFVEVDEILIVKVIEFNCDDKCILVFYLCYFDDICCEVKDEVCKEKQEECKQICQAVKKQQFIVEKFILGDFDVFSQLKDQFEDNDDIDNKSDDDK